MLIENISYLITFIITTGIAVIGSLLSYQLFHESKKPVLQILLYQQIFLFSFFIYGIWGNILLRQVVVDIDLNPELEAKLAFFVPLLGIPFLIGSWFMLVKFAWNLNGFQASRSWTYGYFIVFFTAMVTFAFLFQNNYLKIPGKPDVFLIRLFLVVNLFFHLIFIFPYFFGNKNVKPVFEKNKITNCVLYYFSGVAIYSSMLWFLGNFGFIGINLSFILLFGTSAALPVFIRIFFTFSEEIVPEQKKDFLTFCKNYEISKREAEIILEICSGKTNKAIAEKLFITLQTVKDHTHHIYTKTQVKNRVQLANMVREKTGIN